VADTSVPHQDQAIEAIFRALEKHHAAALRCLRDGVGDVRTWAESHHLLSDPLVRYAADLRSWWSQNPRAAQALRTRWRITLISTGPGTWSTIASREQERQRLESERHTFNLAASEFPISPEPPTETLRQWVERATQVYRDINTIRARAAMECGDAAVHRRRVWCNRRTTFRYAEGFVLRQLSGFTDLQIARRLDRAPSEAAAIGYGARLMAKATSIRLRRAKRK
jgi:hypothetical protein